MPAERLTSRIEYLLSVPDRKQGYQGKSWKLRRTFGGVSLPSPAPTNEAVGNHWRPSTARRRMWGATTWKAIQKYLHPMGILPRVHT